MTTVTIGVATEAETQARMLAALQGRKQGAHISFPTVELLWRIVSPKRWDILRAMAGAGPTTIREVARCVARDVKPVHGDIHALLAAGIVERTEDGRIVFPYDAVRVDFTLRAA
jgi:predicted transcriptional regulator